MIAELYGKLMYETIFDWYRPYSIERDLMTVPYGPRKGDRWQDPSEIRFYDNDPRLIWSVLLNELMDGNAIQFSWYDWADFRQYNRLLSLSDTLKLELNCDSSVKNSFDERLLHKIDKELKGDNPMQMPNEEKYIPETSTLDDVDNNEYCSILDNDAISRGFNFGFNTHKPVGEPDIYQFNARNYLMHSNEKPLSLTIMSNDNVSYRVPLKTSLNRDFSQTNFAQSGSLHRLVEKEKDTDILDHEEKFEKFIKSTNAGNFLLEIDGVNVYGNLSNQNEVALDFDDFLFDSGLKIDELVKLGNELDDHDQHYLQSLIFSESVDDQEEIKYFRECGHIKGPAFSGSHRDWRFFSSNENTDQESLSRHMRMNSLIRNFLKFTKANGFVAWIAHGSAFGYLYNGMSFPWDSDADVQMPIKQLHLMARYFNQSLILEDPRQGNGRFLVDVGSTITKRTHGKGKNNIDARFIDIMSGYFIDITGLSVSQERFTKKSLRDFDTLELDILSERKLFTVPELEDSSNTTLNNFSDSPTFKTGGDPVARDIKSTLLRSKFDAKIAFPSLSASESYSLNKHLKAVNCRNNHFLLFRHITPLKVSSFHGTMALVPQDYIKILKSEYDRVPVKYNVDSHEAHLFIPYLHSWISHKNLRMALSNVEQTTSQPIENNIRELNLNEIFLLYQNMLAGNLVQYLAELYKQFDITTLRQKELEIETDSEMHENEKNQALIELRTRVAPLLKAPFKDPYMFEYERGIFLMLTESNGFTPELIKKMMKVDEYYMFQLWQKTMALNYRKSKLLMGYYYDDKDKAHKYDFNSIGRDLFFGDKHVETFRS